MKVIAEYTDFSKLDVRVGTILTAKEFEQATKPAILLTIDFGSEIGILKSSAQITAVYNPIDLLNTQVIAIVNFPEKQIANVMSQCLVLGLLNREEVVLIKPERPVPNGLRLG